MGVTVSTQLNKELSMLNSLGDAKQTASYRLLVESIQDYAIFLLDTSGRVSSWNAGAQKLKGYKANEIIGNHFSIFYPQKDKDAKKPEYELMLARRDGRVEDEGWRIKKDGSRFWANVVITALHSESGKLLGYAKVTRDLTERKKNEEKLKKMNTTLLRQQKELKKLNKAKDEFISLVSHQLRTPATIVRQYLGILLSGHGGKLNEIQKAYLHRAQLGNERQIETVNDLLRVAQIDAGRVRLNKQDLNVDLVVEELINDQSDQFAKRKQKIALIKTSSPHMASIDLNHFRMALENLISNASKYTPEKGSVNISICPDSNNILISIEDTGVGIKESDISKLFKPFSRIPNKLSERVGGSGLGLYWANKVIDLHGGHIDVKSKFDEGTIFNVFIPASD